jgi:Tfp pilus assembly protein PilX
MVSLQKKTISNIAENEDGIAIVSVLLILLLLSIIAVTMTNTTITDKSIVRSEAIFEQGFYLAESGASEGIQRLDNESDPEELLAPLLTASSENKDLLVNQNEDAPEDDRKQLATDDNTDGTIDDHELIAGMNPTDLSANTYRLVVQMPTGFGNSLALGQTRQYEYMAYGVSMNNKTTSMIKMGYRKRF